MPRPPLINRLRKVCFCRLGGGFLNNKKKEKEIKGLQDETDSKSVPKFTRTTQSVEGKSKDVASSFQNLPKFVRPEKRDFAPPNLSRSAERESWGADEMEPPQFESIRRSPRLGADEVEPPRFGGRRNTRSERGGDEVEPLRFGGRRSTRSEQGDEPRRFESAGGRHRFSEDDYAPRAAGRGVGAAPFEEAGSASSMPKMVRAKRAEEEESQPEETSQFKFVRAKRQEVGAYEEGSRSSFKFGRAKRPEVDADEDFAPEEVDDTVDVLDPFDTDGAPGRRTKLRLKDKDVKRSAREPRTPRMLPVIVKDVDEAVAARLRTKQRRLIPSAGRGRGTFDASQWEQSRGGGDVDPVMEFSLGEILRRNTVKQPLFSRESSRGQVTQQDGSEGTGQKRSKVFKVKKSSSHPVGKDGKDAEGKTAFDRRMERQADIKEVDFEGITDDKERCAGNVLFFRVLTTNVKMANVDELLVGKNSW
jgi:hypothetical protein